MVPTKLACPHCGTILKSSKTVPVGKQITCVKCHQRFAFTQEMELLSTGDSHAGTFHMLAESQPGTMRSPVAGMNLVATVSAPRAEPDTDKLPKANGATKQPLIVAPPGRRSLAGFFLALLGLLIFVGGGTALAIICLSGNPDDASGIEPIAANPDKDKKEQGKKKTKPPQVKKKKRDPDSLKTVTAAEQKQIDEAIEKGVRFLRAEIKPWGNWDFEEGENAAGYAALPGLALLESKVPPSDPVVQKAADFVRRHGPELMETYDIGLAIVFLDRLGDSKDRDLIRSLTYRLVAGQSSGGGWGYKCPVLNVTEERQVEEFLKNHRPRLNLFDLIEGDLRDPESNGKGRIKKGKPDEPVVKGQFGDKVKSLPIVKFQEGKGMDFLGRDDNSNTLFGLLGLWAGRRHGVDTELALEFAARRFRETQRGDGGWGYVHKAPTKNTMTCVGLLGLAMGHGAAAEMVADAVSQGHIPKAAKEDPYIQDALISIGKYIDGDRERKGLESRIDVYYLWTLERVGMLYHQKTFGKRDWYRWGSKFILENQKPAGSWQLHYTAPVDTSFSLLFLGRSNLVQNLTDNLQFYLAIPEDLDRRPGKRKNLRE